MKLSVWTFDLPLRYNFQISRGSVSVQSTLMVELEHHGQYGYGEATTSRYYQQTINTMAALILAARKSIESLEPDLSDSNWPAQAWARTDHELGISRFAQCAIDEAMWDLFGKLAGKPLQRLWGLDSAKAPLSNYTIGIDTIEVMREKLREFSDWPVFKVKLGTENDAEILRAMRQETTASLRVDANCGWNRRSAEMLLPVCVDCGVEFVEQPFASKEILAMQTLKSWSPLPLIADESCVTDADVPACDGLFHGINIKLVKCGGLTPAIRMIKAARQRGLSVMLGCMTESSVGISAVAQLAPLADSIDMDGAVLLANDIADGVRVVKGRVQYPTAPGSGVVLLARPEKLGGRQLTS